MRAIFVDGPSHGICAPVEGEPERIYTPAQMMMSIKPREENIIPSSILAIHVYRLRYKTRNKTLVYEYIGQDTSDNQD